MEKYIIKPNIQMYPGIRVNKDTELEFECERVKQTVKDLKLHSVTKISGEGFQGTREITVFLKEGDLLLFLGEPDGYIKPVDQFMTVKEAVEQLKCIEDI